MADENSFNKIDPLNRVQVIADVMGLAWIGKLEYAMAFNIIQYLQHEPEYLPWKTALTSLTDIRGMLRRTPIYGYFKVPIHKTVCRTGSFDSSTISISFF